MKSCKKDKKFENRQRGSRRKTGYCDLLNVANKLDHGAVPLKVNNLSNLNLESKALEYISGAYFNLI
jgi:hypothetical protein